MTWGRRARQPSALEWLRHLAAKQVSAHELAEHYLRRIDRASRALDAIGAIDPERVLAEAQAVDRSRRGGSDRALLGLPITVGGDVVRAGETVVLSRLRAAGAIVIATSGAPGPDGEAHAAILGADASAAGVDIDDGASVRALAHFHGVVGLRACAGRMPEGDPSALAQVAGARDLACPGPLARFVDDVALLFACLAGHAGAGASANPAAWRHRTVELGALRVAVYDLDGSLLVTPGTRSAVRWAAQALSHQGAEIVELTPPGALAYATDVLFGAVPRDTGAPFAQSGLPSLHDFRSLVRRIFSPYDIVLCPVAAGPASQADDAGGGGARPTRTGAALNFSYAPALAGLPAISVPVTREDGLPVGVQVVGRHGGEDTVLGAAGVIERSSGGFCIGADRRLQRRSTPRPVDSSQPQSPT